MVGNREIQLDLNRKIYLNFTTVIFYFFIIIIRMKKTKKDSSELKWFITIFVLAFKLSIIFSFISTTAIGGLSLVPAVLVLLLVIFVGIVFDIIGVSVTVGKESDFNAMAAKKIPGSKTSLNLIKNSAKYLMYVQMLLVMLPEF